MDSGGEVAGAMYSGGEVAGTMDSGDWRAQLLPDSRQKMVNKIMLTLSRHLPVYGQELMKIAVRFEEKVYTAATSQNDYRRKISLKMLTMETKSQNPMTNSPHPNAASSGILVSSEIKMDSGGEVAGAMDSGGEVAGAMDSGDWRAQLLPDSRQRMVNKIMETLSRHLPVYGQELMKIAVTFEEKVYTAATSQNDYLRKISLKMLTIETKSQNPMTNSPHANAASSGQNAHGPEAASYETISGPEESDKEDEEDVSKEVVVTEEQKSAVGHKENLKVVKNEISYGLNSGA